MMRGILLVGFALYCCSSCEFVQAADAVPCPPKLFGASEDDSTCGKTTNPPPDNAPSDTEYGPTQISGGQCPRIPQSFPATYQVTSESEFASAYAKVQPGEAIIIKDGSYTWGSTHSLDKKGTAERPIYIVYQNFRKALFSNNEATFRISGSHHIVAGFRFNSPKKAVFEISGPDNRIACHYLQTGGGNGYVTVDEGGAGDRLELDNNVFDDHSGIAVRILRCNPMSSSCTNNPVGAHIHHNTWKNKSRAGENGHEAIRLGTGYSEPPGVKLFSTDLSNLDAVIENNLFQNWNGEEELISIKSDHNIIRNNCIIGSQYSNIVIRHGKHNLITGNWSDGVKEGIRISGRDNYYVFNYRRAYSGGSMFRLHPGELFSDGSRFKYTDATGNILRYNVSGSMQRMVETEPRLDGSYIFHQSPTGNIISDNVLFSSSVTGSNTKGSYENRDGKWIESQFRSNNTWGNNTIINRDLPESQCGNPTLFDGPGGPSASVPGSSKLLGSPATISAPSWW
jgi:hypothetical protein